MPVPILVLSDLHAGSRTAICPPTVQLPGGGTYTANLAQRWLYEAWIEFTEQWLPSRLAGRKCIVVLNGDLVEGVHHGGGELVDDELETHMVIARDLLLPLIEAHADRVFVVRGTECHTRNLESAIGKAIGAEPDPERPGQYARDEWRVRAGGLVYSFKHHIGTTSRRALEATQLSIQLAEEVLQCARASIDVPDVICRAHRHVGSAFSDGRGMACIGWSWQGLTRHGNKVVTSAQTGCGGYLLDAEDDGVLPVWRPWVRYPRAAMDFTFDADGRPDAD